MGCASSTDGDSYITPGSPGSPCSPGDGGFEMSSAIAANLNGSPLEPPAARQTKQANPASPLAAAQHLTQQRRTVRTDALPPNPLDAFGSLADPIVSFDDTTPNQPSILEVRRRRPRDEQAPPMRSSWRRSARAFDKGQAGSGSYGSSNKTAASPASSWPLVPRA